MTNTQKTDSALDEAHDSEQDLVYGISHDMGAPLRSVVQFSQLLQNRLGGKLDEKETYWLELIHDNGVKAQEMIDALLVYSRLSSERNRDKLFSLQNALESAISNCGDIASKANVTIDHPQNMPEIMGCKEHWTVFFGHLINNAIHYQPKDEQHKVMIKIVCVLNDKILHITVEDNGIGVPEEQWARLTMPFKRMQAERDYPGMGMGLAYCNRIAKQHKGGLEFSVSTLGGLAVTYFGLVEHNSMEHSS